MNLPKKEGELTMKRYDVFKSEGGYRVCRGTWAGGPIISQAPWFATKKEAKKFAAEMRTADIRKDAEEILTGGLPEELYSEEAREMAKELKRHLGVFMATMGRKGGASKSAKKAAASRENGRKGGRPKMGQ